MTPPSDTSARPVTGAPRLLLRLEGAAVLVIAVGAYASLGHSWVLFALLFLTPDLTFFAYALGPRAGAWTYNAAHTYVWPLLLGTAAFLAAWPLGQALALIGGAHIGMDRALGYGLKYGTRFQDTHLGTLRGGR